METETVEIIDVIVAESSPSNFRQIESIQPKWFKPAEILHRCRMEKTALQQSIAKLTDKYKVPLSLLRRGAARNTEYSAIVQPRDKDFLGLYRSGALILLLGAMLPFWDLLTLISQQILIGGVGAVIVLAIALIAILGRN